MKRKDNMIKCDLSNPYVTKKKGDIEEVTTYNFNNEDRQEYIDWLDYEIAVYEKRVRVAKSSVDGYEKRSELWKDQQAYNDYVSIKESMIKYEDCLGLLKYKRHLISQDN